MPPLSPEHALLRQTIAEARARLRAHIHHQIAMLHQIADQSQQLVQELQRERLAVRRAEPQRTLTTTAWK